MSGFEKGDVMTLLSSLFRSRPLRRTAQAGEGRERSYSSNSHHLRHPSSSFTLLPLLLPSHPYTNMVSVQFSSISSARARGVLADLGPARPSLSPLTCLVCVSLPSLQGQTLSEPVVEKHSGNDASDRFAYAYSEMQGWRICECSSSRVRELEEELAGGRGRVRSNAEHV
jgi:hypothetical protein